MTTAVGRYPRRSLSAVVERPLPPFVQYDVDICGAKEEKSCTSALLLVLVQRKAYLCVATNEKCLRSVEISTGSR